MHVRVETSLFKMNKGRVLTDFVTRSYGTSQIDNFSVIFEWSFDFVEQVNNELIEQEILNAPLL